MDSKLLMLGDWMDWPKSPFANPHFYSQVVELERGGMSPCIGIPLTPEILEKNGWMQNGMTQEAIMECDGENCDDTWCEMTYDGELNCYFDYEEDAVLFTCDRGCDFLKIHFVHELQHALRLCGLDKLADNFQNLDIMTNEEQVNIIIGRAKVMLPMIKSILGDSVDGYEEYFKKSLLNMAEWKDWQFKEYLEKKMAAKLQARESFKKGSDVWWDYTTSATAIEEIINELFKED